MFPKVLFRPLFWPCAHMAVKNVSPRLLGSKVGPSGKPKFLPVAEIVNNAAMSHTILSRLLKCTDHCR
jgi:hypothetical protein